MVHVHYNPVSGEIGGWGNGVNPVAIDGHELLMLPNERHMPRDEPGRVYVERRMRDFFQRTLGGAK